MKKFTLTHNSKNAKAQRPIVPATPEFVRERLLVILTATVTDLNALVPTALEGNNTATAEFILSLANYLQGRCQYDFFVDIDHRNNNRAQESA